MPDTTPFRGKGFVVPFEGRVTPGQAFAALPPRWAFQMQDSSDALDLDCGSWVIAEPCDCWVADCRYVLRSGEVVRLRCLLALQDLELTRGDGTLETITLAEARAMIVARVVRVLRP